MSWTVEWGTYLPDINNLPAERVADTRARLQAAASSVFPEVDARPNSPFGDLYLTPASYLVTARELAAERMLSDLDLSRLSRNIIYNCPFVEAYLASLGVSASSGVAASGLMELSFPDNTEREIPLNMLFVFNGHQFRLDMGRTPEPGVLRIFPRGHSGRKPGDLVLFRSGDRLWSVIVPVTGPSGAVVADGVQASTDYQGTLSAATAVGIFDPGSPPDTLDKRAAKVPKVFAAAVLSTPSGVLSWLHTNFPSAAGASVVVSGDAEMTRDRENILGVRDGRVDLHVRGPAYNRRTVILRLSRDHLDGQRMIGPLPAGLTPLLTGELRRMGKNWAVAHDVMGRSADPLTAPGFSGAYSKLEELGVSAHDNPTDEDIDFSAYFSSEQEGVYKLTATGTYAGHWFSPATERRIEVEFTGVETVDGVPCASASVRDLLSGERGLVRFKEDNGVGKPLEEEDYQLFFRGLGLRVGTSGTGFNPATIPPGTKLLASFASNTALYEMDLLIDPLLEQVKARVGSRDNTPPMGDILVRGFLTLEVKQLEIHYRRKPGSDIDRGRVITEILDYLHVASYPGVYEDSKISEILLYWGAAGVRKIVKEGELFRTQADFYRLDGAWHEIPRNTTQDFVPDPADEAGAGPRNTGYVCDASRIKLKGVD